MKREKQKARPDIKERRPREPFGKFWHVRYSESP